MSIPHLNNLKKISRKISGNEVERVSPRLMSVRTKGSPCAHWNRMAGQISRTWFVSSVDSSLCLSLAFNGPAGTATNCLGKDIAACFFVPPLLLLFGPDLYDATIDAFKLNVVVVERWRTVAVAQVEPCCVNWETIRVFLALGSHFPT